MESLDNRLRELNAELDVVSQTVQTLRANMTRMSAEINRLTANHLQRELARASLKEHQERQASQQAEIKASEDLARELARASLKEHQERQASQQAEIKASEDLARELTRASWKEYQERQASQQAEIKAREDQETQTKVYSHLVPSIRNSSLFYEFSFHGVNRKHHHRYLQEPHLWHRHLHRRLGLPPQRVKV